MTDHKLPDVLQPNLRVVFCGTAAGRKSSEVGAYYAQPGNQFWPVLHRAGFTPMRISPVNYRQCLEFGIGLTDLAKLVAGVDAEIEHSHFDSEGLLRKVQQYRPAFLAFTSKKAGETFFNLKAVDYGPITRIGDTVVWVLPSTSGMAKKYWDESWWCKLAEAAAG